LAVDGLAPSGLADLGEVLLAAWKAALLGDSEGGAGVGLVAGMGSSSAGPLPGTVPPSGGAIRWMPSGVRVWVRA